MLTENLVLAIMNDKVADADSLFEEIVRNKVTAIAEAAKASTAALMLDEETKEAIEYMNAVHNYCTKLVEEDGKTLEEAVELMANDEDIGAEVVEEYIKLLEGYLAESEEGEEEAEEEEETEEKE